MREVSRSELAVGLADHLAWPVVVFFALLVLGPTLRSLIAGPLSEAIQRMRTGSIKAAGVEVEFSAEGVEPEEAAAEALEEQLRPQVGQELTAALVEQAVRKATAAVQDELKGLRRYLDVIRWTVDTHGGAEVTRTADGNLLIEPAGKMAEPPVLVYTPGPRPPTGARSESPGYRFSGSDD